MTRRTLLGALKCAFRELRRELDTILAIAAVGGREMGLVEREVESSLSKFVLVQTVWATRERSEALMPHGRLGPGVGQAQPTNACIMNSNTIPATSPRLRVFPSFAHSATANSA